MSLSCPGLWLVCMAAVSATCACAGTAGAGAELRSGLPTLFVVGDSTVGNRGDFLGWGDVIGEFFDPSCITVSNRGKGGRSTRSFRNEGAWDGVLSELKPGDYVLIQFGHNDSAGIEDPKKAGRGTIKGIGPGTVETRNNPGGNAETVHTFGWYLRLYISEAKARGATPVVLSPVPRNYWKGNTLDRVMREYAPWAEAVAREQGVPYVDLEEIVATRYTGMGREAVKDFFPKDKTHTNAAGARLNARCVVEGLRSLGDFALVRCLAAAPAEAP